MICSGGLKATCHGQLTGDKFSPKLAALLMDTICCFIDLWQLCESVQAGVSRSDLAAFSLFRALLRAKSSE